MRSTQLTALAFAALLSLTVYGEQFDPAVLRPVGYHPSNVAYFNTPYLANALAHGGEWYEFTGFEFGSPLDFNALPAQFIDGYPQFLEPGQRLRGFLFGLNINNDDIRPAGWPIRNTLTKGHVVMTWQGNADVRLVGCTLIEAESNGGATGLINNGRRSYLCDNGLTSLEVHAIQTPITDLKVWLPALDDPATTSVDESRTTSLENQLFHPLLLERIADLDWGFIRFMDWGMTNASPQQDWADRRKPGHIFQAGIINDRSPTLNETSEGGRETGVAFEHMIALCNATGRNMWINVPHLATDEFIRKLAQVIRFGSRSDGEPALTGTPAFPPLNPELKVFVEYSNEIWSGGFAFPQGNWAEEQSVGPGEQPTLETKGQFTARRFCETWSIFQEVFGGPSRLIRVAAIFTANNGYSEPFLKEIEGYCQTLTPVVRPDIMAVTTYFGNGIQDFVNEKGFTSGKMFDDPYWASAEFGADLTTAFNEWKRRILSGDSSTGSGPDATGIGGGFSGSLRTMSTDIFGEVLPIVAYEGGPSLFTDTIDLGGTIDDDGVTIFIEQMNRDPRIAEVYRMHLDLARSKGLWTHTPYVDTSLWSRFGQWGHLETLDQNPVTAAKYALMLEHFTTYSTLRHIDAVIGTAPSFSTSGALPVGIVGESYTTDIVTAGGAGPRTITVVGSFLDPGLTVDPASEAGNLVVTGTPAISGKSFILARVSDADGDPAWRIFTVETFGGAGTLVQTDFNVETSPALNLPWNKTLILSPEVTWSGWNIGSGIIPQDDDDSLSFSVSAGSDPETLAQAIADQQFLTAVVAPAEGTIDLREAEFRFSIRRLTDAHSPNEFAVFSSVGGFAEANALARFTVEDRFDQNDNEFIVTLPNTTAFSTLSDPVEFRIYVAGARFDGKRAALTAFKLTEKVAPLTATSTALSATPNPSVVGQSVTLSATVTAGSGGATATGTITFRNGSTLLGTVDLTGGSASFSTSALPAGQHSITATYSGSDTLAGSTSPAVVQTVNKGASTTTLSSSANPAAAATSITFTAVVNPASATGTVTFRDGETILGTGSLTSGVATFSTAALTVGDHLITAAYGGDALLAGSTSAALTQTIESTNPNGDANGDGVVTVADIFYLINHLFAGGPPAVKGDANGDGVVSVGDIFYLINFLFAGGPPPG